MSRTDAHRPTRVWLADHPELVREHHDHTAGGCPLAEGRPLPTIEAFPGCYADLPESLRLCACARCSDVAGRRHNNRDRRTGERVLLRAAVRGAADEELDQLELRLRRRGRR